MDTLTDVRGHFALGSGQTDNSIQFSSVPSLIGSSGVHEDDSTEILFQPFLREDIMSRSYIGRDVIDSLALSIQHFLCRLRNTSPLPPPPPVCPERWFWGAVVACGMSEPCEFPSLDRCQKRLLLAHKEVDLVLHPDGQADKIKAQRQRQRGIYRDTQGQR